MALAERSADYSLAGATLAIAKLLEEQRLLSQATTLSRQSIDAVPVPRA